MDQSSEFKEPVDLWLCSDHGLSRFYFQQTKRTFKTNLTLFLILLDLKKTYCNFLVDTVAVTCLFLSVLFNFGSILGIAIFSVDSFDAMNMPFLVGTSLGELFAMFDAM